MLVDMEKRTLSYIIENRLILAYSNIPTEVHLFACCAQGMQLRLNQDTIGKDKVDQKLKSLIKVSNFSFEWDTKNKGKIFTLSNGNKTFYTGKKIVLKFILKFLKFCFILNFLFFNKKKR